MALRYALLGALADRPRTGYELLKHFEQSLAYAWPASHSQIYPELARLREDGLIEQTDSGARNSKTYAVTADGLAAVRRWLRETEPDRRVRNDALLRTFFLWLLEPDEARAQLARERAYWQERLDELEQLEAAGRGETRKEQAFRVTLEGGLRMIRTRLEWLEWADTRLRAAEARGSSAP